MTTLNNGQNAILHSLMGRVIVTPVLSAALFALFIGFVETNALFIALGIAAFVAYGFACLIAGRKVGRAHFPH